MKRGIPSCLFLTISVIVLSCSNGKASQAPAGNAAPAVTEENSAPKAVAGKVAYLEEPVLLARDGAETKPALGDELFAGDVLTTGPNGRCAIELAEIGSLEMESESSLRIDGVISGEKRGAVSVLGGATAAKIGKLTRPDAFVIRSGSVVCGVRGTEFRVEKGQDGKVSLSVQKGTVSMFPDALVTSGLHPSAELIGVSTDAIASSETMESIIKELPTVGAGKSVEVPAEAFASAEKEIEVVAAKIRQEPAETRDEQLLETLKDVREIVADPSKAPPAEPESKAEPAVSPAMAQPNPPEPAAAPAPEKSPIALDEIDVPKANSAPKKLPVRKGSRNNYSFTVTPIIPPALGEEAGEFWPRPAPVHAQPADKAVRSPLNESNALIMTNKGVAGKATASFEEGRAVLEVTKTNPTDWLAFVELKKGPALKKDAVYHIDFTAWTNGPPVKVYALLNEGGNDINKDGDVFSTYVSTFVPVVAEARRYRVTYQHAAADNPKANVNISAGNTAGSVYIQDITVTELGARPGPQKKEAGNLIDCGTFSRGFLGWEAINNAEVDLSCYTVAGGRLRYRAASPKKEAWHTQLITTVPLKKGQRYRVSFDGRFSGKGLFGVGFDEGGDDLNKDGKPFSETAPYVTFDSKDDSWFRYTADFNATAEAPRARMTLNFGNLEGIFSLDNLRFEER